MPYRCTWPSETGPQRSLFRATRNDPRNAAGYAATNACPPRLTSHRQTAPVSPPGTVAGKVISVRLLSLHDLVKLLGRDAAFRCKRKPGETEETYQERRRRASLASTRVWLDREERKGRFPKRIRLSPAATKDGRAIGLCRWDEQEVLAHLERLKAARVGQPHPTAA